jgi:serine/threonine-protein kinase
MALSPGTRLGVYEVTAQIGEGGMGQVFRAHDTRLNRDVALKILPDAVARDPDRLARFTREAQTLASLNHAHIAQIHGLEESSGVRALVMELVEGEDLSQRIARGAIPLADVLPIAKQIAAALEAAHEQGIIHRDLKPANVKVRPDGTVKVLDFGLAKAMEPTSAASSHVSHSPTITTPAMTQAGMILGTAAYMSPEQAKGRAADRRSDVWAFGVLLYEMLTGQRAFKGEDVSDTLAFILTREPDWATLPAATPPPIRRLLRRCLEKDRTRRLCDIGDARLEIDEALAAPSAVDGAAAQPGPGPLSVWSRALPWMFVASMLGLAIAVALLWAPWRAETHVDRPLVRLDVDLGTDVSLPAPIAGGTSVAISPDGTRFVYASGTPTKLFTRRLDQPTATELSGTQGASRPFFSPDGQWVAFLTPGKLNKISVEGGAVVPLGDINTASYGGASWGEDRSIVVSEAFGRGLLRIPAAGGPPDLVAPLGHGEFGLDLPQLLPGGKAILFAANTAKGDADTFTIEVLTLADRHRKIVVRGGQSPRYLPTSSGVGHLIYVNKATLFAIPFDLDKLETRGTAVPVLDGVAYQSGTGMGQFDASRTGTLVYRRASGGTSGIATLQWVDPIGKTEPLLAKPGAYVSPSLSPDGKRIALGVAEGGPDVSVYDPQRDVMTRLTSGGFNGSPKWSPDGQSVVFASLGNGILQTRADGASQPQALTQSKAFQTPWSFTPDGKRLAYVEPTGNLQIWTVPLEDQGGQLKAGAPEPWLKNSFNDTSPAFSPDGRWLAYQSNESGTFEVYVRAFASPSSAPGGKWEISNTGGMAPRWSRNGHELVYQSGDRVMAARYTVQGDAFVAEKPRVWIAKLGGGTLFDVSPDGRRVAVLAPVASADASKQEHEVVLLLNFFDELRRRVPVSH